MQDELVAVGRLMRSHGVHGDILCKPLTHDLERHAKLKRVLLESPSKNIKEALIVSSEVYGDLWRFRFKDYDNPEDVQELVNSMVLIPESERLPLPEGQYYFSDFDGFSVLDASGNICGRVLYAEEMPSVNVFNLLIKEQKVVAPWIDDCILNIDMASKRITVNLDYIQSLMV